MIVAIEIGRGGSTGFPGKNSYEILGHPLMAYPLMAVNNSKYLFDDLFFSTEDEKLKQIAIDYGASIIDRPKKLATNEALADDVFVHAYNQIKNKYKITRVWDLNITGMGTTGNQTTALDNPKEVNIDLIVLLFANAPCITGVMIDDMIDRLRAQPNADSICTVSEYQMFSPYRMREIKGKWLRNWHRSDCFIGITCDRSSGEVPYIYDCSCAVVRPVCLERITEYGLPPQRWLGQKILYYKQDIPALDVDFEYQLGQISFWLKEKLKDA